MFYTSKKSIVVVWENYYNCGPAKEYVRLDDFVRAAQRYGWGANCLPGQPGNDGLNLFETLQGRLTPYRVVYLK